MTNLIQCSKSVSFLQIFITTQQQKLSDISGNRLQIINAKHYRENKTEKIVTMQQQGIQTCCYGNASSPLSNSSNITRLLQQEIELSSKSPKTSPDARVGIDAMLHIKTISLNSKQNSYGVTAEKQSCCQSRKCNAAKG